jgi:hypothetical protein
MQYSGSHQMRKHTDFIANKVMLGEEQHDDKEIIG